MRYWNILKIVVRNAYIRDTKILGVVTANIFVSIVEITITLTLFSAIFGNIQSLDGWNYYQVVFLYMLMKNITLLNGVIARSGLVAMAREYVRMGDYDFYLTKPVNSMLLVGMSKPKIYYLITLLFTLGLTVWTAMKSGMEIRPLNIFVFLVMFTLASILYFFLTVVSIVPSFWFVRLFSLADLMNRSNAIMRYPAGIYSLPIKIIFFTAFPVLAITYIPSFTLFYSLKPEYIIYMFLITAIFGVIAVSLWGAGEKHYGSASS